MYIADSLSLNVTASHLKIFLNNNMARKIYANTRPNCKCVVLEEARATLSVMRLASMERLLSKQWNDKDPNESQRGSCRAVSPINSFVLRTYIPC